MTTYIIRHGRSKNNTGETASLDSSLTPDGVSQCRMTGKFLSDTEDLSDFTIYTSPLLRCLMTTEQIILGAKGKFDSLKVVVQPLIHESLQPNSPDVTVPLRKKDFPNYDWSLMKEELTFGPDDGRKLIHRCASAIIPFNSSDVFVSHGATCIALALCSSQKNPSMRDWDYSISNASITKVVNNKILWWGRALHVPIAGSEEHLEYSNKYE